MVSNLVVVIMMVIGVIFMRWYLTLAQLLWVLERLSAEGARPSTLKYHFLHRAAYALPRPRAGRAWLGPPLTGYYYIGFTPSPGWVNSADGKGHRPTHNLKLTQEDGLSISRAGARFAAEAQSRGRSLDASSAASFRRFRWRGLATDGRGSGRGSIAIRR